MLLVGAGCMGAGRRGAALAAEPAQDLPAGIVVTAPASGPALWHVHLNLVEPATSDSPDLWLLGTVSPLPSGSTWRAGEVRELLHTATAVLVAKPLQVGVARGFWLLVTQPDVLKNPGRRKLEDVMPQPLYARFAALRARYAGSEAKWERYRPIIASALLEQKALEQVGLSERLDVSLAVQRLARDAHVPIVEVAAPGVTDVLSSLQNVSPATEDRCVDTVLTTIESQLPLLAERARAWARGDVDRLEALPRATETECLAAMGTASGPATVHAEMQRRWLAALEAALKPPSARAGATLAVIDIDDLLGTGGLLEALRQAGYTVDPR
jgi:uncharacterized protein YbaP (TraB family)